MCWFPVLFLNRTELRGFQSLHRRWLDAVWSESWTLWIRQHDLQSTRSHVLPLNLGLHLRSGLSYISLDRSVNQILTTFLSLNLQLWIKQPQSINIIDMTMILIRIIITGTTVTIIMSLHLKVGWTFIDHKKVKLQLPQTTKLHRNTVKQVATINYQHIAIKKGYISVGLTFKAGSQSVGRGGGSAQDCT